jgi:hypothetical protein
MTAQVVTLLAHFIDDDHRDWPVGGAGRRDAGIPYARQPKAVTPGPVGPGPEILPCHPASVRQVENLMAFALDEQRAVLLQGDLRHQLRVPEPTISDDQGGGQRQAAPLQCHPRPLHHDPQPCQLVVAGPAGTHGVRPADGEVYRDDPFAVPDHDHKQQPINPLSDSVFLTTPPRPHQPQAWAILLKDAVIAHPCPLPATAGGRTLVLHMPPQGLPQLLAPALQVRHPFPLGQGTQNPAGEVLVPDAHAGQFRGGPAPKERREHQPKDFAQQFRLGLQCPLDFLYDGVGQAQLLQRLFEGLQVSLRPSLFPLQVLPFLLKTTLLGLLLSFLPGLLQALVIVFGVGHGQLLRVGAAPRFPRGGDHDPFCYVLSSPFMDTWPLARMDGGY